MSFAQEKEEDAAAAVVQDNDSSNDNVKLPRVKKKGIPLWVFRLIRCMLCLCPFDAYVCFPVLFLMIIAVLGFLASIFTGRAEQIGIYVLIGVLAAACMAMWLHWARKNPKVPQGHDVAKISLQENWPTAPVAPLRGELVANKGSWFLDDKGRRLLLRGVNFQGSTKLPMVPSDQSATHLPNTDFVKQPHDVSFVGRPFPLQEFDLHLGRLRCMGMTVLRFLITWEAIEHEGPGIYDLDYLQYLHDAVEKCHQHGISVFIDFHQDVWSRWTGGDGAPAWTLEQVGFDLQNLDQSAAALTQQHSTTDYPKMVWNSNNSRLAAGTMWTLFFAGNDYAPNTTIDNVPVQDYLQNHLIGCMAQVALALKDLPNVLGFDILNEPSVGFVGVEDVRDIGPNSYFVGWRVDPWSAMQMGAGETCTVTYFSSFMLLDGTRQLNTSGACAWLEGPTSCVWFQNGVWKMNSETNKPQLLKPYYFATNPRTGKKIDFLKDYGIPFWKKAQTAIRQHMPDAIMFAEPILDMTDPSKEEEPVLTDEEVGPGYVWASHYYDGITLMTKSFSKYMGMDSVTQKPSIGVHFIQESYAKGISVSKKEASRIGSNGCPVLIGECGIPFDMGAQNRHPLFFNCIHPKSAFETGDFSTCTNALNRTMCALEDAQVSYTIWCYQPDNTNKYGDGWNGEDLSLFSRDQIVEGDQDDLFAGGRSLQAAIRPYPHRVAGKVIRFSFDLYHKNRKFELVFDADHGIDSNETEIFLPKYQYPHGVDIKVKKGEGSYKIDWDSQTLTYTHVESSSINHIVITKVLAPRINKHRNNLELQHGANVDP